MTDHDQTTIELMRERNRNSSLWTLLYLLAVCLAFACLVLTVESFRHSGDIAALTAKCGLERP